ncbi:MAG: 16S rRNA (guanine(966)-N(2))-methyltransferase RsmD [Acidobacteriaceae bacterium]|nr:16S rRNA (guanine(966)-N(2))-methyltransferase RsmD [Acidobacteriaceae bacterium]
MRIIAGQFRSRKIKSVPGLAVRPTPDRLREALFNILAPRIAGAVFLDAYAGSGAVGIEALSRGAKHVVLIERNGQALAIIRENIASLGIGDKVTTVRGSATVLLRNYPCDIAFVDPPYEHTAEYANSMAALADTRCTLVVAQHPSRLTLEDRYGNLQKTRVLRQGDNSISFYERTAEKSAGE